MSISMHIQNLDKFYKRVLKILSGNEKIMTDEWTNGQGRNDRQPKSYIAPPFSKRGYYNEIRVNLGTKANIMYTIWIHTLFPPKPHWASPLYWWLASEWKQRSVHLLYIFCTNHYPCKSCVYAGGASPFCRFWLYIPPRGRPISFCLSALSSLILVTSRQHAPPSHAGLH